MRKRTRFRRLPFLVAAFREQTPPAASHFFVAPCLRHVRPGPKNDVDVVRHRGKTAHIDRERAGQFFEPVFNPLLAMIVTRSGHGIAAAEPGASDAPVHAMIDPDFPVGYDVFPSARRHGGISSVAGDGR